MMKLVKGHFLEYRSIYKFLALFIAIYFGLSLLIHVLIGASIDNGRFYSPFIDEHFNIARIARKILLNSSAFFVELFGYETTIDDMHLKIDGSAGIRLVYSCIGFDLMSVWLSFIIAYPDRLLRKTYWVFFGMCLITFLNIIRIGGLTILYYQNQIALFNTIDHHDLFNWTVYLILFVSFFFYAKKGRGLKKVGNE